ncbi:putative transcriptional regulator [Azorhizobium caulinodans ORS 571]|uniref:Putative transcriptional regulator n=1 Tax=Azorhizobium caulinodans (strain ATCC 43989 / DSM 5975 / JCM 20966 / LMG 6465 / NBRC 14845 / NCIMB 13405 / ORS 571) TaxID=438753 RepID=A8IJ25_AZOC5|nr:MucR family transcriptional regulator [Azorhizobium caulinodans]BAF86236.1 putative transcriptional regulator [Azorhizobium caulinodans ORS 571]
MDDQDSNDFLAENAAQIVSAFVAHNSISAAELPNLIQTVHATLAALTGQKPVEAAPKQLVPAVSVKRSITPDYIICLEDGLKFKSLKRHLMSKYGLTPDEYRKKWDLPYDYPMVAPNYALTRSAMAKEIGLGRAKSTPAKAPEAKDAPARKPRAKKA